jgi:hypothetical protein
LTARRSRPDRCEYERRAAPVVPPDLVLRLQKYRDPVRAPRAVRHAAETAAAEAAGLIAPTAVIWRGPVTAVGLDGAVTLDDVHHLRSRLLARVLTSSREAYVTVITLGAALERRVDELFAEQSALEALMLETAGWAAIMVLARRLRRRLRTLERRAGRSVTHRVAPGYGDWPVDEQRTLLRVFGDVPLPVHVTESAWMLPRKSISGIFGVVVPS